MTYEEYMCSQPVRDGLEMRYFFDDYDDDDNGSKEESEEEK